MTFGHREDVRPLVWKRCAKTIRVVMFENTSSQTNQTKHPTKYHQKEREKIFTQNNVAYQKSRVLHSTLRNGILPRNSTSSQRQNEKITNKG